MKNPWTYAMLIIILLGYFAWNNFEFPLLGKTEKLKGRIYSVKYYPAVRGRGDVQGISYFYIFNDRLYEAYYVLNFRHKSQSIGNSISIKVLVSNPEKVEVLGFYKQSNHRNKENKYYSNYKDGYSELLIENRIYKQTDYLNNKGIAQVIIGKVNHIAQDSITLVPFKTLIHKNNDVVESELFDKIEEVVVRVEQKDNTLVRSNSSEKIYKRLE